MSVNNRTADEEIRDLNCFDSYYTIVYFIIFTISLIICFNALLYLCIHAFRLVGILSAMFQLSTEGGSRMELDRQMGQLMLYLIYILVNVSVIMISGGTAFNIHQTTNAIMNWVIDRIVQWDYQREQMRQTKQRYLNRHAECFQIEAKLKEHTHLLNALLGKLTQLPSDQLGHFVSVLGSPEIDSSCDKTPLATLLYLFGPLGEAQRKKHLGQMTNERLTELIQLTEQWLNKENK